MEIDLSGPDGVADAPVDAGPGPFSQLVDTEWQKLLDKDDRTSPAEYPDHVLITKLELSWAMAEANILARSAPPPPNTQEPVG